MFVCTCLYKPLYTKPVISIFSNIILNMHSLMYIVVLNIFVQSLIHIAIFQIRPEIYFGRINTVQNCSELFMYVVWMTEVLAGYISMLGTLVSFMIKTLNNNICSRLYLYKHMLDWKLYKYRKKNFLTEYKGRALKCDMQRNGWSLFCLL